MKALLCILALLPAAPAGETIHVPEDKPTVQQGVDAAKDGDTVRLSPGVYRENVRVAGKKITISSRFAESRDALDVERTVIDGDKKTVITVARGAEARIEGLTLRNGRDGICCDGGRIEALHNRLLSNQEGISFEGGRGIVRANRIEGNSDDGIDCDQATDAAIEENVLRDNGDDGIEVRLHAYTGPKLTILVRNNLFSGNREDGLQLIDYPGLSDRVIRVERNVFHATAMAGLGCMEDGNTKENFKGAPLQEPVFVIGNTFVGNHTGLTGADSMIVVNNIFAETRTVALKRLRGASVASHNLFWQNGKDHEDAPVEREKSFFVDPLLDPTFKPGAGSPAIDAGAVFCDRKGTRILDLPRESYLGPAPDLGAFELR